MSGTVWQHAVRLDEPASPSNIARLLDHWGHGPANFSAKIAAASGASSSGAGGAATGAGASAAGGSTAGGTGAAASAAASDQQQQGQAASNYSTASASSYRTPVASHYVVFACVDGVRFLVSHSVARMCDSLTTILDDLDLESEKVIMDGNNNSSKEVPLSHSPVGAGRSQATAEQLTATLIEDCAVLEVALAAQAMEAVLVYLALCLEHGAASSLPYPLGAPLSSLVAGWENQFLAQFAPHFIGNTNDGSRTPSIATAMAAVAVAAGDCGSTTPFAAPAFSGVASFAGPPRGATSVRESSSAAPGAAAWTVPACPPLLSLLRAADYLGIHTLRDLAAASLADGLLRTRDEGQLAAMLGLTKLPKEHELEDVFARFPFLNPSRNAGRSSTSG
jgi:hypothetical protein